MTILHKDSFAKSQFSEKKKKVNFWDVQLIRDWVIFLQSKSVGCWGTTLSCHMSRATFLGLLLPRPYLQWVQMFQGRSLRISRKNRDKKEMQRCGIVPRGQLSQYWMLNFGFSVCPRLFFIHLYTFIPQYKRMGEGEGKDCFNMMQKTTRRVTCSNTQTSSY